MCLYVTRMDKKSVFKLINERDPEIKSIPPNDQLQNRTYGNRPMKMKSQKKQKIEQKNVDNNNRWHGVDLMQSVDIGETQEVELPLVAGAGRIDVMMKGKVRVSKVVLGFVKLQTATRKRLAKKQKDEDKLNSELLGIMLEFFSTREIIKKEVLSYSEVKGGSEHIKVHNSPSLAYALLSFFGSDQMIWFKLQKEAASNDKKYPYSTIGILLYLTGRFMKTNAYVKMRIANKVGVYSTLESHGKHLANIVSQIHYLSLGGHNHSMSKLRHLMKQEAANSGYMMTSHEIQFIHTNADAHHAYNQQKLERRAYGQTHVKDFNVERLLNFKNSLIASDNWIDKVLLVQLCVGSRFIEVLSVSQFYTMEEAKELDTPVDVSLFIPENNDQFIEDTNIGGSIVVIGVAKSKKRGFEGADGKKDVVWDLELEDNEAKYEIDAFPSRVLPSKPVMYVSPAVIVWLVYGVIRPKIREIVKSLGKRMEDLSLADLTGIFNDHANSRLEQFPLTSDNQTITTHWLRKIYANYSYDNVGKNSGMTKTAWISRVLGHLPKSFTTALSYNTASISDELKTPKFQNPELIEKEVEGLMEFYNEQTRQFWELQRAGKILSEIKEVDSHADEVIHKLNDLDANAKKKLTHTLLYHRDESFEFRRVVKGTRKANRILYFEEVTGRMINEHIPLTYENYRRIGFSNSFIHAQKAQQTPSMLMEYADAQK